jgi:hypothetical protein
MGPMIAMRSAKARGSKAKLAESGQSRLEKSSIDEQHFKTATTTNCNY